MRQMTKEDVIRLGKRHNDKYGVPGMIGSIDCTHVGWKNCPNRWKGQFTGKEKNYNCYGSCCGLCPLVMFLFNWMVWLV